MVVENARLGLEDDVPAGLLEAIAEINVVEVEGELLVEEPHFVERGAAKGEGGGHGLVYVTAGVVVPVGHAIAAERLAPGEEAREAEGIVEDCCGLREAAARGLDGPVGEEKLRGNSGGARFLCEHV